MELISINVGLPREVDWRGRKVLTSIWKTPVEGRVAVRQLNLAGDQQSDLSVHGGPEKAVYVYPSEHYAYWREELPGVDLPWGAFGENLTTQGLREDSVQIGDRLRIGSADFLVTQPRMPCYKLGIRFTRIRDSVMFRRKVRRSSDDEYFTHVSLYLFSVRGGLLLRERFELERDLFFKDQPVIRTQQIS